MFLMAPAQDLVAQQMASLKEFPPARGSSLSLGKLFEQIQFARPGQQSALVSPETDIGEVRCDVPRRNMGKELSR